MDKMKLAAFMVLLFGFPLLSSCGVNQKSVEQTPTGQYFTKDTLINVLSESYSGYDNDSFLINAKDPSREGLKKIQKSTYQLMVFTSIEERGIGLDGNEFKRESLIYNRDNGLVFNGGYVLATNKIFWKAPPPIPPPPGPNPPPVTLEYKKLEEVVFLVTFKGQNNFADSPPLEKIFVDDKQPFVLLKIPDWQNFSQIHGIHFFPFDIGDSNNLDLTDYLEIASFPMGTDYVSTGNVGGFTLPENILAIANYPESQIFVFTNPIFSGDGGAPIIAFENGEYELVGIVIGFLGINSQGFSWGLKINFIAETIKEKTGIDLKALK